MHKDNSNSLDEMAKKNKSYGPLDMKLLATNHKIKNSHKVVGLSKNSFKKV